MPRQDRTGPNGAGPRTGRGFGTCGTGWGQGSSGEFQDTEQVMD